MVSDASPTRFVCNDPISANTGVLLVNVADKASVGKTGKLFVMLDNTFIDNIKELTLSILCF